MIVFINHILDTNSFKNSFQYNFGVKFIIQSIPHDHILYHHGYRYRYYCNYRNPVLRNIQFSKSIHEALSKL